MVMVFKIYWKIFKFGILELLIFVVVVFCLLFRFMLSVGEV